MNNGPIPRWIHWLVLLVVLGQLGAIGLKFSGLLQGPQRNLVPQALIGGAMALTVLAAYVLRYHSGSFRPTPKRPRRPLLESRSAKPTSPNRNTAALAIGSRGAIQLKRASTTPPNVKTTT